MHFFLVLLLVLLLAVLLLVVLSEGQGQDLFDLFVFGRGQERRFDGQTGDLNIAIGHDHHRALELRDNIAIFLLN